MYSLCKNNVISKKFLTNYMPFTSVVLCTVHKHYTNGNYTLESYVFQKPPLCNDNGYKV